MKSAMVTKLERFLETLNQRANNRLITVYYGSYDSISNHETISEDYYVNIQNSATSEKGISYVS